MSVRTVPFLALVLCLTAIATSAAHALNARVTGVAAALHAVDVPKALGGKIETARRGSGGVAVLLPDSFMTSFPTLYGDVRTEDSGLWELYLGAERHCFGANVCGVATFIGQDGGDLYGKRRVKLHDGITGRFMPTSCGASCSPPSITWRERGVAYTISLKGVRSEKATMKKLANEAIDGGPRSGSS